MDAQVRLQTSTERERVQPSTPLMNIYQNMKAEGVKFNKKERNEKQEEEEVQKMMEQTEVRRKPEISSDKHPSGHKGRRDVRGGEEMMEMEMEEEGKDRWRRLRRDDGGGKGTPQLFGPLTNIHYNVVEEGDELRRAKMKKKGGLKDDEG